MNTLDVIQHTSADYLGLMEDHLEGRRIRFNYIRPFTERGRIPASGECKHGLVLLGGGPWGTVSGRILPSLAEEIALTRIYLSQNLPVIGIELGAQILAIAAGGGSQAAPLEFDLGDCRRVFDNALNGFLPEQFPMVSYMRDRPQLPGDAQLLAVDWQDRPAIFQVGANSLGFCGHPGFKPAMAEDLVMEFEEGVDNPVPTLERLRLVVTDIEDTLVQVMTGVMQVTDLMQMRKRVPITLIKT